MGKCLTATSEVGQFRMLIYHGTFGGRTEKQRSEKSPYPICHAFVHGGFSPSQPIFSHAYVHILSRLLDQTIPRDIRVAAAAAAVVVVTSSSSGQEYIVGFPYAYLQMSIAFYALKIPKHEPKSLPQKKGTTNYHPTTCSLSISRLSDKLREFLHTNRLSEILVNASVESIGPRLFAGNTGQSTDVGRSEVVGTFVFADLGRGLEAVHDRHVLEKELASSI